MLDLGCESEGQKDNFFAIEIPKNINYQLIKMVLDNYENQNIIQYAEPILSIKHQEDIS